MPREKDAVTAVIRFLGFCGYAFHDSVFRRDVEVQRSLLTPCRSLAIEVSLIFRREDLRVFSVL